MMDTGISMVGIGSILTGFDDAEALGEGIVLQASVGLIRVEDFANFRR
jgi:hypothetical protein